MAISWRSVRGATARHPGGEEAEHPSPGNTDEGQSVGEDDQGPKAFLPPGDRAGRAKDIAEAHQAGAHIIMDIPDARSQPRGNRTPWAGP